MTITNKLKKHTAMAKNNIILIGMMGSGKTTVGKALVDKLGAAKFNFIDLDTFIVQKENLEIPEIFSKHGEEYFRNLETETIKEFSNCKNTVISTGGGIVKESGNLEILKKIGTVFYLSAPPNVLYARIKGDEGRPLLKTEIEFNQIFKCRKFAYTQADYTVDATKNPQEIVQEIILKWK